MGAASGGATTAAAATAAGGIGQYYEAGAAASAAASAAAAAAAAAHRQQHPHIQGRLEAGGLKEYLTTAPPLPQNHLYTINPAVPKETFVHHKVPVHSGNLGALDKVGGVSGFFNAPPTPGVDPVPSTRGVHQALHALSSLSLSTTAPGGFAPAPPSSLSASAGSAAPAPAKMSALEALASAAEADLDAEQPTGPPLGHKVVSPASSAPPPPQPAAHQTPSSKGARGLFLSHLEEGSPAVEPSTPAAISQAASALADLSLAHLQSTPSSAAKPAAADSSSGFDLRRLARVRKAIRDVRICAVAQPSPPLFFFVLRAPRPPCFCSPPPPPHYSARAGAPQEGELSSGCASLPPVQPGRRLRWRGV